MERNCTRSKKNYDQSKDLCFQMQIVVYFAELAISIKMIVSFFGNGFLCLLRVMIFPKHQWNSLLFHKINASLALVMA